VFVVDVGFLMKKGGKEVVKRLLIVVLYDQYGYKEIEKVVREGVQERY
jgi:hypothetical protein